MDEVVEGGGQPTARCRAGPTISAVNDGLTIDGHSTIDKRIQVVASVGPIPEIRPHATMD
jgi:hypothetical protein